MIAVLLLSIEILLILLLRCLSILIFGLMVARKTTLLQVGLKLLVLVFFCLLLRLLLKVRFGERQRKR